MPVALTTCHPPQPLPYTPTALGNDHRDQPTRRDFLGRAGTAAVVTVTCAAGVGALRLAYPSVSAGRPSRFAIGTPADFRMGTLTLLGPEQLFLLHERDGFAALSARCTHLGCIVRHDSDGFQCPCHGASFDRLGRVLTGPARRPLSWHPVWQETDGRLWVDTSREIEAGTFGRGA